MFDSIPDGWFLYALEDVRTPIRFSTDVHRHKYWSCELQWVNGGGRLCEGTGATPEDAIAAAVKEVQRRWPQLVATSR